MRTVIVSGLLVLAGLAAAPHGALATTVQSFDGSGAVYMNYETGADELLVSNFANDVHLAFDIYQSTTPTTPDSWTLNRSYTSEDFTVVNSDYFYTINTEPAVEFKGDWYFTVTVQSAGDTTTLPEAVEIWRITKRGGKPKRVFTVPGTSTYFAHSPLVVLNDKLVFVDAAGGVYRSSKGRTWTKVSTLTALEEGAGKDVVSNGKSLYVAVDGEVYRSKNAENWTSLESPCADQEGCSIDQLAIRSKKGIFVTTQNTASIYTLWIFKRGAWTEPGLSPTLMIPTHIATFGKKTYLMYPPTKGGYYYFISEVASNGSLAKLTKKRDDVGMGFLTADLALTNPEDGSSVNLVTY